MSSEKNRKNKNNSSRLKISYDCIKNKINSKDEDCLFLSISIYLFIPLF